MAMPSVSLPGHDAAAPRTACKVASHKDSLASLCSNCVNA